MQLPLHMLSVVLASHSSASDGDDVILRYMLAGALLAVILIAFAVTYDPNKWYGKMKCMKCGYHWSSRRNTPPARCPKCGSNTIITVKGL